MLLHGFLVAETIIYGIIMAVWLQVKVHGNRLGCGIGFTPALSVTHRAA